MLQDADSSTLITLAWALWIYWSISTWLEHFSSLAQDEEQRRGGRSTDHQIEARSRAFSGRSSDAYLTMRPDLEAAVSEILRRDGAASVEDFLANALAAYEAIVAAFDVGDRETLRGLASAEIYDAFLHASAQREAQREQRETVFSQIEPPQIVDALVDDAHMEISIRFFSEAFKLSRNAAGQLMEEAPAPYRNVDTWTFARMLSSGDSAWRLVATEVVMVPPDPAEAQ